MASPGQVLCLLTLSYVAVGKAQEPPVWAHLYTGPDQTGARLTTEDYLNDLLLQDFDDKASSYCVSGVALHILTPLITEPYLGGQVSSLRQAGSPISPARPSLTLYGRSNFRGQELYLTRSLSNFGPFKDEAYSAIVTGDIPWTVYTYDDFQGAGTCLEPQQWVTVGGEAVGVGLFPTYHELGSSGALRSARLGCEARQSTDQTKAVRGADQKGEQTTEEQEPREEGISFFFPSSAS
ncbi:uncharacterized protein LOC119571735 isoform X2 [Penaeus monodon]|uniref:uncharacterized protein LOC119571735 isoform X2 n=1 Tax=Penaeus monodon TaxID=6687 RepID=UPI0018A7972F|nr:uncharacterized protein LOC119571735 isoform X2 [Penaeus monodon]